MSKTKIKIAIIFISFCQGLQYTISPVLNQIQDHYPNINRSLIQMLITAPALLSMVVAIASGWLVVKTSKKKLLLIASFITGITGFVPLISDSFGVLFFARTFFGVGLGLVTALNTAVVAEHFEGKERVSAMGIQGASVGTGMLLATTLGGLLGAYGYQFAYFVHVIGFISMFVIWWTLPDTGKVIVTKSEKIKLNSKVYKIALLGMLEFMFLIAFTTNIAMHLSGKLAGNSSVTGTLIGVFSGVQIIMGLTLGHIVKYTGRNTLTIGMICLSIGSFILVLSPSSYLLLLVGAVFCGMSQGIFIPQAMCEVAGAVKPVATAMASAAFTVAMCLGQLISPTVLNGLSKVVFGKVTTSHVYTIAAISMLFVSLILMVSKRREKTR